MPQKYPIGTIFKSETIEYRITRYEKTLCDDLDDHYEVCFDEESDFKIWTKQSYLDKLEII